MILFLVRLALACKHLIYGLSLEFAFRIAVHAQSKNVLQEYAKCRQYSADVDKALTLDTVYLDLVRLAQRYFE